MIVTPGSASFFEHVLRDGDERPRRSAPPRPVLAWQTWWREQAEQDPVAAVTGFVRTPKEIRALGVTRSRERTAVRRGEWVQARRGLVAPVEVTRDLPEQGARFVVDRRRHALISSGAGRARPQESIAGRSAAILHGLPTVSVPAHPELLAVTGDGARPSAHLFSAALGTSETSDWYGRRVTSPARTLVELGRHDRFDAIMAVDAALREDAVTTAELIRALSRARGWPGVRQAREVLALADPLSESPLESVTRLRILEDGLPAPQLQVWIGPFRVDFYWPRFGVVLEADGRGKYTSQERWAEKKREQVLRRLGVRRVERVTWEDVFTGWRATSELLHDALR